jgi:hypothetical protein
VLVVVVGFAVVAVGHVVVWTAICGEVELHAVVVKGLLGVVAGVVVRVRVSVAVER